MEYIESTGTQYIDTGFVYDNNTRVVWDIQLTAQLPLSTANNSGVGYVNTEYSRLGFSMGTYLKLYKAWSADSNPAGETRLTTIDTDNNRHVIEINSPINKAYVDGTEYTFNSAVGDINNEYNLTLPLLAWLGDTGYREYFIGKLYSTKIWDNGTLERDFIPARRNSDGRVGLYDLVYGVFYTNAKTTAYTQLESLSNSSTSQYIQDDTLTSLDSGTIEIKVGNCLNKGYRFVGWGSQTDVYVVDAAIAVRANGSGYALSYGGEHHWFVADANVNDINIIKYKFEPDLQEVRINGILSNTSNQPAITNHNYPFRMFRANVDYSSHCTIYYCKVYDGSGNLLREYIPAKDSNNVLGMYETQTGRFLTNAGSGTFTAGSNVGTYIPNFIAGPEVNSCDTSLNILNEEMCVETTAPVWPYLTAWYNNNTYYIKLSENDYPIHSGSSHKLQIITNGKTYNAHDESVE